MLQDTMSGVCQSTHSLVAVGPCKNNIASGYQLTDDQYFLLSFITGAYFGPDLKDRITQKCALQRLAEGLPLYSLDQLTGSKLKLVDIERVYYYVLRKANESVVVPLNWLHHFFHRSFPACWQKHSAAYPQFFDLFPPKLHPISRFKNQYYVVENVIFIHNPQVFYIKLEDIARFKGLTGLEDFCLERNDAMFHTFVGSQALYYKGASERVIPGDLDYGDHTLQIANCNSNNTVAHLMSRGRANNTIPIQGTTFSAPKTNHYEENVDPRMIFLPMQPSTDQWSNIITAIKSGYAVTGSAAAAPAGPILGLIDIGECEDSYLFRVSLPGVKRNEKDFSCEVETDGKVVIKGVTVVGEVNVRRYSQVFEMQSQNLCPPGRFSISFRLPGAVDPQQFSGNFGTDGILEGFVMKAREKV